MECPDIQPEIKIYIEFIHILTALVVHAEWPTDRIELTTLNNLEGQAGVHAFTFTCDVSGSLRPIIIIIIIYQSL